MASYYGNFKLNSLNKNPGDLRPIGSSDRDPIAAAPEVLFWVGESSKGLEFCGWFRALGLEFFGV